MAVVPDHVQTLSKAIEKLHELETEVLARIAKSATPDDREEYRDIRDTLKVMEAQIHRQGSRVMKLLKFLHLIP